eukprot:2120694-Pleurochrysis_carterae.AAC.1
MRACVRASERACVRACVRVYTYACVIERGCEIAHACVQELSPPVATIRERVRACAHSRACLPLAPPPRLASGRGVR